MVTKERALNVLVIAPHADDEVLGAGGSMARHIRAGDNVFVCVVATAEESMYPKELIDTVRKEANAAHRLLGVSQTFFLDFPVLKLLQTPSHKISEAILKVINEVKADVVYVPFHGDVHIDHKVVFDASMVSLRPIGAHKVTAVYAYETLSETEWAAPFAQDAFIPNVWSDISPDLESKLEAMKCYRSQLKEFPHPRSLQGLTHLARLRGSTVGYHAAEAFVLIRQIS